MSQSVKEIIVLTASYYNVTIRPEVLAMYADDLADLDPAAVIDAYKQYRRNPRNRAMPLPAQIREIIQPVIDPRHQAQEVVSRIFEGIKKCGWCDPDGARAYIGEIGWSVVESHGGWMYVCENLGVDLSVSTFRAQARDLAESRIVADGHGIDRLRLGFDFKSNDLLKAIEHKKQPEETT